MKVKTSVTLPDDLLRQIDRSEKNRSAFFERAARQYLHDAEKRLRRQRDAMILDKIADRLNKETADVLEYQTIPE